MAYCGRTREGDEIGCARSEGLLERHSILIRDHRIVDGNHFHLSAVAAQVPGEQGAGLAGSWNQTDKRDLRSTL